MSVRGLYTQTAGRKSVNPSSSGTSTTTTVGTTIFFAHQANSGDTGIDLTALSMPTALANKGYTNPSSTYLQTLNMSLNLTNLEIISSSRNSLMKISYDMPSSSQITFDGFTADADEIFECYYTIAASTASGATAVVDAQPLVKTYLLPEGATDVTVDYFECNKFSDMQVGAVMVYRGDTHSLQWRNVSNATASPTADGNYQEVNAGNSLSNTIRFNVAGATGGEIVSVISVGSLVNAPTQTTLNYIETMNGSLAKIIEVLSDTSGQPESYFEGLPNATDLSQFSTDFGNLEDLIASNYLGSSNATLDKSEDGRGIFLRSPDGTLYEITVKDGGTGIDIYSV